MRVDHQALPVGEPGFGGNGSEASRPLNINQAGAVAVGIDTKCPYIQEASNSPAIRKYGEGLIQILESPRIQSMLQKNQELIGPFQDDVIVFKFLKEIS
jgi:hypothetical protein